MGMRRFYCAALFAAVLDILSLPSVSEAVAFKMKNDSQYTLRVTVHDRGRWRPWVVFRPGDWGDFATQVKRTEHDVRIEIWNGQGWNPLYANHHGSRMFTRIVQVFNDVQGRIYFAWWDEPPGCRGAPPYPGTGGRTCLKPSGWVYGQFDKLIRQAVKAGSAYLLGG